jgi:hypothetical protein
MEERIKVKLPDGSILEVAKGTTPLQIAEMLSKRLSKEAVAAKEVDKGCDCGDIDERFGEDKFDGEVYLLKIIARV